jgi:tripartite-type tricarboxylate transporter receptor subunit TctC
MKLPRRKFLHLAAGAAALPAVSRIAWAQAYPTRPVRVIVPYAPGGPTDIFGRLIAQSLSEHLGKQFYVENIGGAGGNVGMGHGARAAPDGYTILVVPPNFVVNPALYNKVPYDPYKDFDPVTIAVTAPPVLSVHPSLPVQTVRDLVGFIKSSPGKYNFASGGTGTPGHLVGEQFRLSLGLDLVHVPFNSAGLAVGATVAGPGEAWFAVIVPARVPKEIIALLHREIVKTIALPGMKERMATLGYEPVGNTPEECAAQFRTETTKWGKVLRDASIKAQ